MSNSNIHPTAIIDPNAQLHESVEVGAYTLIGAHVVVEEGTRIGSHCSLEGRTHIGKRNFIANYASLGAVPQDKKYAGEPTQLVIGDDNTIREFSTLNLGTVGGGGVTRVGNHNLLMAYVHLAHDCQVGNHTIFANNCQLAGHVKVEDWVILGGFTVVRQFLRLGAHSFTAMCSLLFADLPPFITCQGQPAHARTANYEGLRRRGFSPQRVQAVRAMYKTLYREKRSLNDAIQHLTVLAENYPEAHNDIHQMNAFLQAGSPKIGIVRPTNAGDL